MTALYVTQLLVAYQSRDLGEELEIKTPSG